jgi:4-amino-4-deoxy-L-arabinose transferase-like glycosyltransferase
MLLVGSFLFYRYGRLAETDVLVTLALTVAIGCIWRGFDPIERRPVFWFAISGIAIGFAGLAKGPPALYAIVFLVAMTLITRRWRVLVQWTISGAPLFAALIGLSWWMYARSLPQGTIVSRELSVLLDEPNHPGWFFVYFPLLLRAMLPWSPIVVIALIDATVNWPRDSSVRARLTPLLIWCGSILVPLFFVANKQDHYLLPMMPPLAIIAAWWLMRADQRWTRAINRIAGVALVLAALALPVAAQFNRGDVVTSDLLIAIVLLVVGILLWRRLSDRIGAFCVASAMTMSALMGAWFPSIDTRTPRTVANEIRELGAGPYCFYGENFSLPLVYHLRQVVPQTRDARELTTLMSQNPTLLIIAQTKSKVAPPPVPIGCETIREIFMKDQKFEIYRSIQ